MAMRRGPRVAVGSEAWIAEQRTHALDVARQEAEEFSFSARNELDWLNEHMAEILSENHVPVTELFKTPGKLRGKTPRTVKKTNLDGTARAPLSNLFSATPKGAPNPFAIPSLSQAQQQKIKVAEDRHTAASVRPASPAKQVPVARQQEKVPIPVSAADSGYYGSQSQDTMAFDDIVMDDAPSQRLDAIDDVDTVDFAASPTRTMVQVTQASPTGASLEQTFESAKEEQTRHVIANLTTQQQQQPPTPSPAPVLEHQPTPAQRLQQSPIKSAVIAAIDKSPMKTTTPFGSPVKRPISPVPVREELAPAEDVPDDVSETMDDIRSPSEDSSPVRTFGRKSSFNLPSLPAREPLASNKSLGPRVSRISHLEPTRTSYYQRPTGGKSLGGNAVLDAKDDNEDDDHDAMDVDETESDIRKEKVDAKVAIAAHNKTYTQRLQDQISKLGQTQAAGPRPSKSLAHLLPAQQPPVPQQTQPFQQPQVQAQTQPTQAPENVSPAKESQSISAPGAFPEDDDDDDWIEPPATLRKPTVAGPRPALPPKSYTADVMEGVHGKETVGGFEFALPKSRPASPKKAPAVLERTTSTPGHSKSASVPALPNMAAAAAAYAEAASPKKTISVSNPSLYPVAEDDTASRSPPKSPSRTLRDSPLKHVKDKLSSILGKAKGQLASSAALSAESKSSLLSPSMTRLGFHAGPSTDSLRSVKAPAEPLYPDLSSQPAPAPSVPASPTRPRRTRGSIEREKKEAKEKEREEKERQKMDKQLEKARQKEAEKARVFNKEREGAAEMEKQIAERETIQQQTKTPRVEAVAPAPPPKSPPKTTRTSPRKAAQSQEEIEDVPVLEARQMDGDVNMLDPSSVVPPPQIPRAAAATPAAARAQGLKRPMKPTQVRQEPTVIRFKPGSTQQSQYHPSNRALAANLGDTLGSQQQQQPQQAPQRPPVTKPVPPSLKKKTSTSSFSSSIGPSGRPKALDLAAKKREEAEEQERRRRELKANNERKRQEERKQEEQRRAEAERQKEEERKAAERAKKIEKAKRTPAPPPAARPQPNVVPEYSYADKGPSRPPSRLGSMIPQDSSSRLVGATLTSKMAPKRPLQQEAPQPKEKRFKASIDFDDDLDMAETSQPRIMKGPPVRPPSLISKQQLPKFNHGYAPAPTGVSVDLFKQMKTTQQVAASGHLNTAQFSQGQIPGLSAAPSTSSNQHKTPARAALPTGMKSAAKSIIAKSSPFGKQGDDISLPDINSDEDDDDSYASSHQKNKGELLAEWTNSPDLRQQLFMQERVDPFEVFGPPAPINMEEIFAQPRKGQGVSRFRARTSSANWSGQDRLTEEECLRDNLARERMMREGKWSHDMVRDGLA